MGVYGGASKSVAPFFVYDIPDNRWVKDKINVMLKSSATDAALLDVTCCVRFRILLHAVGCCWELLRKV